MAAGFHLLSMFTRLLSPRVTLRAVSGGLTGTNRPSVAAGNDMALIFCNGVSSQKSGVTAEGGWDFNPASQKL